MTGRPRRYPGTTTRLRPDRAEQRQIAAAARQAARAELTPAQQLARLDQLFGAGVGAKRERARLAKQIAAKPSKGKVAA